LSPSIPTAAELKGTTMTRCRSTGLLDRPDRSRREVGLARHAGEHQGQGVGKKAGLALQPGCRSEAAGAGDAPWGPSETAMHSSSVSEIQKRHHATAVLREGRDPVLPVPPRAGGLHEEQHLLPCGPECTSSNVVKYLNGIRNAAQEDDLVVVYMSSHGTPPDKFGGVYIVTYDTEVNPGRGSGTRRWRRPH